MFVPKMCAIATNALLPCGGVIRVSLNQTEWQNSSVPEVRELLEFSSTPATV